MNGDVLIHTKEISKVYQMGSVEIAALSSISLEIGKNEYVSLIGPSGSGKSTLMNILGGLDTPDTGEYWLNGQNISQLSDEALAAIRNREIGFIFQTFNLIPRMTAVENVALPLVYAGHSKSERIKRAVDVLSMVGLKDRQRHKPNELSGGQRQRVAIARALVNEPAIILADEPTGNLDSHTSAEIMHLLDDLHDRGHTIIIVTHEADIAGHTDRVVRLRDGMVEADNRQKKGTHKAEQNNA